jgi:NAD+ synthase (glutamine-hydrolysing)
MKIALAQLNYQIGNFELNTKKIIESLEQGKAQGADLVVFSELALCGYPPRDFLEFNEFIELCEQSAQEIAAHTQDVACIIGLPVKNPQVAGKDLFNAAYFIEKGEVKAVIKKALLPNYDIFDEYRYFEPALSFDCIEFMGHKIAVTICEDLWNINDNPLYVSNPMDELIKQQPSLMINIAASPFSYLHDDERVEILSGNAKQYQLPLIGKEIYLMKWPISRKT